MATLPSTPARPRPSATRYALRAFLTLAFLLLTVALVSLILFRGSLARIEGAVQIPGLQSSVSAERDEEGHVTVRGATRLDVARGLGFVHAQDRFFQMDLLRRAGAGRLSELLGPGLVEQDRRLRLFRGGALSREALLRLPAWERALVEAYAEGVNAGLKDLAVRPPEYLLLRVEPEPWHPADSLLLNLTFGFSLQDAWGVLDSQRGAVRAAVGEAAYRFYWPRGSFLDAALDGSGILEAPMPVAEQFRAALEGPVPTMAVADAEDDLDGQVMPGSNAWAVSGAHTRSGAALVADDMHLEIDVPGVWYRAVLEWVDPDGNPRRLAGVTLPGTPTLITGSNGSVAWGFTNTELDTTDLIDLVLDPSDAGRYRTPEGWKAFEVLDEPIGVAHGPTEPFRVTNTVWGPVLPRGTNPAAPLRVASWVMARPEALMPLCLPLEDARSVDEALAAARRTPRPAQNLVVGDRSGAIAWTLIGVLPDRGGGTGEFPEDWSVEGAGWRGVLPPERYPEVINPAAGRIWTANQRILGTPAYLALGDGGMDNGARAATIREGLMRLGKAGPADMLALQLDEGLPMLQPWHERLVQSVRRIRDQQGGSNRVAWEETLQQLEAWNRRADKDSLAVAPTSRFRRMTAALLYEPILRRARELEPSIRVAGNHAEGTVVRLLRDRPVHLLPGGYRSYDALLDEAARRALGVGTNGLPASLKRWGELNRSTVRHRLSPALPGWIARWLDMPSEEQSGFPYGLPRVASPGFGASERFAIEPGSETNAYLHTPSGQSGHFLSPFYRTSHRAWVEGLPTPLLGRGARHRLVLTPRE